MESGNFKICNQCGGIDGNHASGCGGHPVIVNSPRYTPSAATVEVRKLGEPLWCAACGKMGDHGSGSCPTISHDYDELLPMMNAARMRLEQDLAAKTAELAALDTPEGVAMLMEKHGFDKDLQSLRNALELQQQKSLENAEALAASQQRCERLEKFVTKLAALDLGNPDGLHPTQHWVDEARTIIRKEPR